MQTNRKRSKSIASMSHSDSFPFVMRSFVLVVFVVCLAFGSEQVDPRLAAILHSLPHREPIPAWVFFTDKGTHERQKAFIPRTVVTERSLQRRLKVRTADDVVDETDLPVEERYVQAVAALGVHIRQRTKWFNGVSVSATRTQLEHLAALPFVRRIERVARFRRNTSEKFAATAASSTSPLSSLSRTTHGFDYGPSLAQLEQLKVPALHEMGNYGQGVIVGVFDNGFRLLNHEAFDTLRTRIIATYDFVDHKVSVVPNNPSTGFGAHGVITLSALGGFKPGQLIGPAFDAQFILARTENDSSETPLEEDNWVAAIEWADSLGVDVTSTSLGYLTYDAPYPSWTWQDMDGNTTVITRAADMAVARGIVVCNSAGNNGFNSSHNTLNAPADGRRVLAIGAVANSGQRASFSSVGPTVDGRIKPDLMAQGVSVRCAHWDNPTEYTYSGGTSLSCPLAAGVVALLLHAKPSATPQEIADVLKQTASRAPAPDNLYGWGIIDALSAVTALRGGLEVPTEFALLQNSPNPFVIGRDATTRIVFTVAEPAHVRITVFDLLGRAVRTVVDETFPRSKHTAEWTGTDAGGKVLASGVYFARMIATASSGRTFWQTRKLILVR